MTTTPADPRHLPRVPVMRVWVQAAPDRDTLESGHGIRRVKPLITDVGTGAAQAENGGEEDGAMRHAGVLLISQRGRGVGAAGAVRARGPRRRGSVPWEVQVVATFEPGLVVTALQDGRRSGRVSPSPSGPCRRGGDPGFAESAAWVVGVVPADAGDTGGPTGPARPAEAAPCRC